MRRLVSLVLAVVMTAAVGVLAARGLGPLPPMGPAFNPGTGVYTLAAGAALPRNATIRVPGLRDPVRVTFTAQGTAFIAARTAHDLFFAEGYLHARFRLFQMDLMRREGEGLLSQIVGPAALNSDRFELELGLLRTARTEWREMGPHDPARAVLLAYAAGVNAAIRRDEETGTLPVMFKLLGYRPAPWTPIDSLVIQGIMTQSLDFTTAPVAYAELIRTLGDPRTMDWFPILPANTQHPYDPGPYLREPPAPIESQQLIEGPDALTGGEPSGTLVGATSPSIRGTAAGAPRAVADGAATRMVDLLVAYARSLPGAAMHTASNSNNWAVTGAKSANGQAMLAGDPHLAQTLPAIWYQVAGSAPGYAFNGVSIPGVPAIVIGMNREIAWSLTNVENQATFFYREDTSPHRPNQYKWRGAWRQMRLVRYQIPVKGGAPVWLTVRLTVHGPLMTFDGHTLAVDWIGALPSRDLDALLGVIRAQNFREFRQALALWHAPSQNFIYADRRGNIGLISAGYYPIVAHGRPWLPLAGTGADDIVGTIPYNAVPQAYDPPDHFVFSANQREVGPSYPYYIGTSMDFFSNGYRADEVYQTLSRGRRLTPADFAALQTNVTDVLAARLVPHLLNALGPARLTPPEKTAEARLAGWDDRMTVDSSAATIWWFFLNQYLADTFGPWWRAFHVPAGRDPNLALTVTSEVGTPLVEDLEAWTLHDPANPAFSPPDGPRRTAEQVMVEAFRATVALLTRRLGPNPAAWRWGRVHFRAFPSLTRVAALGYGPRPSGGDPWTVDAADGGLISEAGPSWRMIVSWRPGHAPPEALGVYPGGQSENPLSPWYDNQVATWWNGRYHPMRMTSDHVTWRLIP
jgi:penicillin amidase